MAQSVGLDNWSAALKEDSMAADTIDVMVEKTAANLALWLIAPKVAKLIAKNSMMMVARIAAVKVLMTVSLFVQFVALSDDLMSAWMVVMKAPMTV